MSRIAKTSTEYIEAINNRKKASVGQRKATFNAIKNGGDQTVAMNKIGQGFVGPIMMRLKYEGIVRNVLTEDPIAPGAVPVYDVADEMGRAYFLSTYDAEAKVSQYEGKRLMYGFRHLAAFPTVQEQDFLELTIDMADYAMGEAQQRIQEQEDTYLFAVLDAAVDGVDEKHPDFAGYTSHVVGITGDVKPANLYDAAKLSAKNRLQTNNILISSSAIYDLRTWNMLDSSIQFREEIVDGQKLSQFDEFTFFTSVLLPDDVMYALPAPDYLGRMPVRKSLEIRENPKLENFSLGWVCDEFVNEIVLNPNGVFRMELQ